MTSCRSSIEEWYGSDSYGRIRSIRSHMCRQCKPLRIYRHTDSPYSLPLSVYFPLSFSLRALPISPKVSCPCSRKFVKLNGINHNIIIITICWSFAIENTIYMKWTVWFAVRLNEHGSGSSLSSWLLWPRKLCRIQNAITAAGMQQKLCY